jgi:dihydrofolate reductase
VPFGPGVLAPVSRCPSHCPVATLTPRETPCPSFASGHGARNTFRFVTDGIAAALAQAREAAGGNDVRVGGGINVIQQHLRQRPIDEMHIAISPVLLGAGESLFEGINQSALGYACTKLQKHCSCHPPGDCSAVTAG